MSEPQGDDRDVDAGLEQRHRRGVPQHVRGDVLGRERRAAIPGGCDVEGDASLNGVGAEPAPGAGREQRISSEPGAFACPGAQHGDGVGGKGHDSLLAALAGAGQVRARAEGDIAAVEAGELGEPQSGLNREAQQGAVTSSFRPGPGPR